MKNIDAHVGLSKNETSFFHTFGISFDRKVRTRRKKLRKISKDSTPLYVFGIISYSYCFSHISSDLMLTVYKDVEFFLESFNFFHIKCCEDESIRNGHQLLMTVAKWIDSYKKSTIKQTCFINASFLLVSKNLLFQRKRPSACARDTFILNHI